MFLLYLLSLMTKSEEVLLEILLLCFGLLPMTAHSRLSIYPIIHHKQIELWGIESTSGNFRSYQIQTAFTPFKAFSPQLVDSNMPLDPSTWDRISLNIALFLLLFRFWYKGNHSFNPKCYVLWTFQEVSRRKFMKTRPILGAFPLGAYKQCSILDPKGDFPCTRNETTISSLGLKCTPKYDLLLGVVSCAEGQNQWKISRVTVTMTVKATGVNTQNPIRQSSSLLDFPTMWSFTGNGISNIWLGITDANMDNTFILAGDGVTDVSTTYENWDTSQPANTNPISGLAQDCVVANLADGNGGKWSTALCTSTSPARSFLCEHK